jgi:hypothetical protein
MYVPQAGYAEPQAGPVVEYCSAAIHVSAAVVPQPYIPDCDDAVLLLGCHASVPLSTAVAL